VREYKLGVMEGKRKGMSGCGGAARGKAAFPNGFEVDREREWLRGCVQNGAFEPAWSLHLMWAAKNVAKTEKCTAYTGGWEDM